MLLMVHRPGTSLVHRAPAGAKLTLLAAVGVGLAIAGGWLWAALALGAALTLLVVADTPVRVLATTLRGLVLVTLALGAWLTWQAGWPRAAETVGDLVALVLLAHLVTATTRVDDMLDTVERARYAPPSTPVGDVGEDAAAARLAARLRGPNLRVEAPFTGRSSSPVISPNKGMPISQ